MKLKPGMKKEKTRKVQEIRNIQNFFQETPISGQKGIIIIYVIYINLYYFIESVGFSIIC